MLELLLRINSFEQILISFASVVKQNEYKIGLRFRPFSYIKKTLPQQFDMLNLEDTNDGKIKTKLIIGFTLVFLVPSRGRFQIVKNGRKKQWKPSSAEAEESIIVQAMVYVYYVICTVPIKIFGSLFIFFNSCRFQVMLLLSNCKEKRRWAAKG